MRMAAKRIATAAFGRGAESPLWAACDFNLQKRMTAMVAGLMAPPLLFRGPAGFGQAKRPWPSG